jgi:hypothetical protein
MVVGLVSGAGTKGPLAATATAGGLVFASEAEEGLAEMLAPVAEAVLAPGGVCKPDVDVVLRAPSILPPDLVSEVRSEGVSF